MNKRGIEIWLSWILLMAMIIGLSALMMTWMKNYSREALTGAQKRVFDSDRCEQISISMDHAICKNSSSIETQITNRNNLRIDQIIFRKYYNESPPDITEINETIKPSLTKSVHFEKANDTIITLEAIPVYIDRTAGEVIICRNRLVSKNMSKEASCR
ncbi:hypothetical protein JW968_06020 [Candidatus Woesearchaeota archaeon]|nr:hypothetical protein [Candidatus Woesearchaeota archaeon]